MENCKSVIEPWSYVYIDNSNWYSWYPWIAKCLMNGHDSFSHQMNRITIVVPLKDVPYVIGDTLVSISIGSIADLNNLFEKLFGENFMDKVKERYDEYKTEYNARYIKSKKLFDKPFYSDYTAEEYKKICHELKPSVTNIG